MNLPKDWPLDLPKSDDARYAEAEALDRAYAEAEAFDAARAARCGAPQCGWVGPLDDLGPLPDDEPEDDCRVLLGSCPMCYRAVYAPDEGDDAGGEDWDRIAGDRR